MAVTTSYINLDTVVLLVPPSLTLILRHKLVRVEGSVFFRVPATTHCVLMPI